MLCPYTQGRDGAIMGRNTYSMMNFLSLQALEQVSEPFAVLVGYAGIAAICIGCAKGIWLFLEKFSHRGVLLADVRMEVAQHLALGLEFLVAKDIVESLVQPTWDQLGKLSVIILLRALLTLFLGLEFRNGWGEGAREQEISRRECAALGTVAPKRKR